MDTNWVTVGDDAAGKLSCDIGADQQALIDIPGWVRAWARQRYGGTGAGYDESLQAWELIVRTVYSQNQGKHTDKQDQADALTSYPVGAQREGVEPRADWYDPRQMFKAWGLLVQVADRRAAASTIGALPLGGLSLPNSLRYDIVNTGREVLAKLSNRLFNATIAAASASELVSERCSWWH